MACLAGLMGGCAATTQPIQRGWDIWHADLAGTGSTDTIFMLTSAFFGNAFTPTCPWYRPPNQIPLEVALYYPIHANVRNSDDDVALRRHFALPAEWEGKSVWLYIEGILIYLWKISRTLP